MTTINWLLFRLIGVFLIASESEIKLTAGAWTFIRTTTLSPPAAPSPPTAPFAPAFCPDAANQMPNPAVFRPNPARVFPFCVGKDPDTGSWDPLLDKSGFSYVIENIDQVRNQGQRPNYNGFIYNASTDHMISPVPAPGAPVPVSMDIFKVMHVYAHDGFGKPKKQQLANWIIIQFRGLDYSHGAIHGIYIQAFHGPLGIPFGQFVTLKHTYGEDKAPDPPNYPNLSDAPVHFVENGRNYPCTFYSKAGPNIPSVFLWSSLLYAGSGAITGKFNVTFRWDDPDCAEVAFFQLLILVVHKWTPNIVYTTALSQVLLPGRLMFPTHSVSVPEYPDWGPNELESYRDSTLVTTKYQAASADTVKYRIVSNLDYEHCVQHLVGLVRNGPQKGACPPGPFKCVKTGVYGRRPSDARDRRDYYEDILWKNWRFKYIQYDSDVARPNCDTPLPITPIAPPPTTPPPPTTSTTTTATTTTEEPLPSPPPTTTRRPTAVENQTKAVEVIAKKVEEAKVIKHGDLCVIVWFVIIPFSNFVARFFKDFGNWPGMGLGFWIVCHVATHHLGVLLMWISFGLVVSNGVSFFGGAGMFHYIFGFPATVIQHFELFSAFNRNPVLQTAERQSIVHVIVGYLSCGLSLLCALYSNLDPAKGYIVGLLYFVSAVATVVAAVVEYKISKILGMYPPRKMFPVIERVIMINTGPRMWKVKLIITAVYLLLLLVLFLGYFAHDYVVGKQKW